uniref:Secreted protein n=1 Tax=Ascaris lumbricoides TaxID=6252 RepID=A0A0M3HNV6_ASCLU
MEEVVKLLCISSLNVRSECAQRGVFAAELMLRDCVLHLGADYWQLKLFEGRNLWTVHEGACDGVFSDIHVFIDVLYFSVVLY